jgi:uncharacterized Zn finger protein (UPF0148 family)
MTDCPNCGQPYGESDLLCPNCGFDVRSQHADAVRRLREEGRIHPGRIGAQDRNEFSGGDTRERPARTELPAEDRTAEGPEEIDAGL